MKFNVDFCSKDYDDGDENILLKQLFVGHKKGFLKNWLVLYNIMIHCIILLERKINFILVNRSPPEILVKDCKRMITFYTILDISMWDLESDYVGVSIISPEINNTEALFGKFKWLAMNF